MSVSSAASLERGSIVCLVLKNSGNLLQVGQPERRGGSYPVSEFEMHSFTPDSIRVCPPGTLFTLDKRGDKLCFYSLLAEGRSLQATTKKGEFFLQCSNHNFGLAESWVAQEGTLASMAFPGFVLGLEIGPVSGGVLACDVREMQKAMIRGTRVLADKERAVEKRLVVLSCATR